MSYAPNYTPITSFADDESNNVAGRSLVKTTSVDTELANASTSINALNTNLKALQRDDNKLKDEIIEPYALSEQTKALFTITGDLRGSWLQNTDYKFKDIVQESNVAKICLQDHNSGSSFTPALWLSISGDGTSAANAAAAAASASAAAGSAITAGNNATAAAGSASAASTSAGNAATQAANALNSANAASALISASVSGVSQATAEAGLSNTGYMSSLRTAQAIAKQAPNQIFAVDSSVASNAMTLTLKAQSIQFRHPTLSNGSVNKYTLTSDVSLTIPNLATLGGTNGVEQTYLLLAIDNSGTIETAVVNQSGALNLDESGLISTTVLNTSSDSNNVIYSTTARSNVPYRIVGIFKHLQTTAGVYAADATYKQGMGGQIPNPSIKSMVRLNTPNGFGSTNTGRRRFSTTVVSQGTDITYADSATLGASFTINTNGVYAISYTDAFSAAADFGIALNNSSVAVPATLSQVIAEATTGTTAFRACVSAQVYLAAGDVISPFAGGSGNSRAFFTITRVA